LDKTDLDLIDKVVIIWWVWFFLPRHG